MKATPTSTSPITFHNSVCWLFFLMTLIFANIFNQIRKFLYILTSCTSLVLTQNTIETKNCDTIFLIPNTAFLLKNFSFILFFSSILFITLLKLVKILPLTLLNLLRFDAHTNSYDCSQFAGLVRMLFFAILKLIAYRGVDWSISRQEALKTLISGNPFISMQWNNMNTMPLEHFKSSSVILFCKITLWPLTVLWFQSPKTGKVLSDKLTNKFPFPTIAF